MTNEGKTLRENKKLSAEAFSNSGSIRISSRLIISSLGSTKMRLQARTTPEKVTQGVNNRCGKIERRPPPILESSEIRQ